MVERFAPARSIHLNSRPWDRCAIEAIEDNHHSTLESRLVKSSRLLRESVMLSRRPLTQEGSQARSRGAVGAC